MKTGKLRLVILLGGLMAVQCAVMPIQMSRISQVEFFTQYYDFTHVDHPDEILRMLLGDENYKIFFGRFSLEKNERELKAYLKDALEVRGSLTFTIQVNPVDFESFFLDGVGRFDLVEKMPNQKEELLLDGIVKLKSDSFSLEDLRNNKLKIGMTHSVVRRINLEAGESYFNFDSARVAVVVALETIKKGEIYRLNYAAPHTFFYGDTKVGELFFERTPTSQYKLIDMRGLKFLRKDYRKYLQP